MHFPMLRLTLERPADLYEEPLRTENDYHFIPECLMSTTINAQCVPRPRATARLKTKVRRIYKMTIFPQTPAQNPERTIQSRF